MAGNIEKNKPIVTGPGFLSLQIFASHSDPGNSQLNRKGTIIKQPITNKKHVTIARAFAPDVRLELRQQAYKPNGKTKISRRITMEGLSYHCRSKDL